MRLELSFSENKIDILRIILLEQSILELGLSSTHNAIVPRRVDYCWVSRLMNFCHLLSGTYSLAVHVWKSSFFKKNKLWLKKKWKDLWPEFRVRRKSFRIDVTVIKLTCFDKTVMSFVWTHFRRMSVASRHQNAALFRGISCFFNYSSQPKHFKGAALHRV